MEFKPLPQQKPHHLESPAVDGLIGLVVGQLTPDRVARYRIGFVL